MSEYIVKCTEVIGISGNVLQIPDYIDLNSEIVRCRDCDYYDHWDASGRYREKHVCGHWDYLEIEPDGFCAWGERIEQ